MGERRPKGAVSRKAVARLLEDALADLSTETELTIGDVRRGERVTIDHVSRLRRTLDALEAAVEWHLAELAADAEPWEIEMADGTDYERPRFTSVLCDRCSRGVDDATVTAATAADAARRSARRRDAEPVERGG